MCVFLHVMQFCFGLFRVSFFLFLSFSIFSFFYALRLFKFITSFSNETLCLVYVYIISIEVCHFSGGAGVVVVIVYDYYCYDYFNEIVSLMRLIFFLSFSFRLHSTVSYIQNQLKMCSFFFVKKTKNKQTINKKIKKEMTTK